MSKTLVDSRASVFEAVHVEARPKAWTLCPTTPGNHPLRVALHVCLTKHGAKHFQHQPL